MKLLKIIKNFFLFLIIFQFMCVCSSRIKLEEFKKMNMKDQFRYLYNKVFPTSSRIHPTLYEHYTIKKYNIRLLPIILEKLKQRNSINQDIALTRLIHDMYFVYKISNEYINKTLPLLKKKSMYYKRKFKEKIFPLDMLIENLETHYILKRDFIKIEDN